MHGGLNVAQKLISSHLVDGEMTAGSEIGLRIDQTLTPGNGVSHPVHMERFGRPGESLAGSDSHTCAAARWACSPSARAASRSRWRWPANRCAATASRAARARSSLIARPGSPGNVVPVRAAAGEPVYQVVGSSANPGLRDFAVLAAITAGRKAHPRVSITDPRDLPSRLGIEYPALALPLRSGDGGTHLEAPLPDGDARQVELVKGPSIGSLPDLEPMPADLRAPVAIKVGDNVSTDEILPAGARVLPFRSDIARLAGFTFSQVDEGYVQRAREAGTHVIVAGENYGQGSSREHAVIAPATSGCDW